jgi:hypothetical protein
MRTSDELRNSEALNLSRARDVSLREQGVEFRKHAERGERAAARGLERGRRAGRCGRRGGSVRGQGRSRGLGLAGENRDNRARGTRDDAERRAA